MEWRRRVRQGGGKIDGQEELWVYRRSSGVQDVVYDTKVEAGRGRTG